MKKILISVIFLLLALSCNDNVQLPDSIYKDDVEKYFALLKAADATYTQRIDQLVARIDFKRVATVKLRTTETLIVADLKENLPNFESLGRMKAIFYFNQNKIVRSNILVFSDKTSYSDYTGLLHSVLNLNGANNTYSGKISFYSIVEKQLLFFDEFENGFLKVNGIVQPKSYNNKGGKTSDVCIDWYLVTTYHFGSYSYTVSDFVYSSCRSKGCDTEVTRMGRIVACGDGGGGTSGAGAFPTNPQNGDDYFETDANGRYTHYKYNSANAIWQLVGVILPPAYVRDSPLPGFLSGIPINQVVHGPDGLVYHYEEANGSWVGELPEYVVDGENNGSNEIANLTEYLKCFNGSLGGEITIYIDQPISGSPAPFFLKDVGHSWIGITQRINGVNVTRLLGFYPKTNANPFDPSDEGKFKDDSPRDFDVSITFDFTASQMSDLLAFVKRSIQDYHLNENNCTNFVTDAFSKSSISLPETIGYWPKGQGLNPGNFGQDMRNYQGPFKSRNTSGGKPSGVSGNCN
jgi:hypothetical protein